MGWQVIAPASASTGAAMASVTVTESKTGKRKLNLFFSAFLMKDFGDPTAATVMLGTDGDEGKLRLEFGEGLAFKVSSAMRFFRCSIPAPDFVTVKAHGSLPCAILVNSGEAKELILELPRQAWAAARLAGGGAAKPSTAAAPTATPALEPKGAGGAWSPSNPLDAEVYLQAKGFKCSRIANGRMMVDGESLLPGQVLHLVNQSRAKSDLEPLDRQSVR